MSPDFPKIEKTAQFITNSMITFITSNLILSIITSSSLQIMWSFVNSLQLISYMPLMKIELPKNLFYVLSLINGPM